MCETILGDIEIADEDIECYKIVRRGYFDTRIDTIYRSEYPTIYRISILLIEELY